MIDKYRQHIALVLLACLVLGFILARQFYLSQQIKRETQPEQEREQALQVSQLIKSNTDLRQELGELREQSDKFNKAAQDKQAAQDSLEKSIKQYEIILGTVPVEGSGISIRISQRLDTAQITDLINALRNIGAEAIAVNGHRITPTSGWNERSFSAPYTISAIGDSELLKDSLQRRGGIMEQLGFSADVVKEEVMRLPAVK